MHAIGDDEFDALLPEPHRTKAGIHCTPAAVARHAAALIEPSTRVLDVGSGVGKFCVIAASTAPQTMFVGVERRRELVDIAQRIGRLRRLDNVTFVHGDAFALDWNAFGAFYLFNPFGELRVDAFDRSTVSDVDRYRAEVRRVSDRLSQAARGTRVVTYHGFGALPPDGYSLVATETVGSDRLALWVKENAVRKHLALDTPGDH